MNVPPHTVAMDPVPSAECIGYTVPDDGYRRVLQRIQRGEIRTAPDANRELADYKAAVHRIESAGAAISARAVQRLGDLS